MTNSKHASTTETFVHQDIDRAIALAPHAGEIEPGTGTQVRAIVNEFERWSAWTYAAEADEGSAFDTYHTPSTEIDSSEHMYLAAALDHPYEAAVAFHGFAPSCTDIDIYVGGNMQLAQRRELAERLRWETGFDAVAARPNDGELWRKYSGTHRRNIINRIITEGNSRSVQLEQRREPRREAAKTIARTVAEHFR